jgi:methionyl-tRNA formyltransferase
MGTPKLAARILERMIAATRAQSVDVASGARFSVVGVVTRPDQPRGRRLVMESSEVGVVASRYQIPTLKPTKIRTPEFLAELKAFDADLIVVAAYGRILPQSILDVPKVAPLNVHASLLPKFRGAAPIEGAILAGERETGVTIMRIIEQMDAGPMYLHRALPIAADDTQGTLKDKLAELGADAILEAIAMLMRGELIETPQDETAATYTKQIEKADAVIDWSKPAIVIERTTRAYDPWPVARTTMNGEEILIWRAAVESDEQASETPGMIVSLKPAAIVQCGVGRLKLIEVQAAGRKGMAALDFFRGKRVVAGARLGS